MLIESIPKGGNSQVQASDPNISPANSVPLVRKGAVKEQSPPDLSRMREVAADLQANIKVLSNVDLHFAVHKPSGQVMVTVTDEDTGKVIREIPSREMLNLASKLEEMMGLIFDRRA